MLFRKARTATRLAAKTLSWALEDSLKALYGALERNPLPGPLRKLGLAGSLAIYFFFVLPAFIGTGRVPGVRRRGHGTA